MTHITYKRSTSLTSKDGKELYWKVTANLAGNKINIINNPQPSRNEFIEVAHRVNPTFDVSTIGRKTSMSKTDFIISLIGQIRDGTVTSSDPRLQNNATLANRLFCIFDTSESEEELVNTAI